MIAASSPLLRYCHGVSLASSPLEHAQIPGPLLLKLKLKKTLKLYFPKEERKNQGKGLIYIYIYHHPTSIIAVTQKLDNVVMVKVEQDLQFLLEYSVETLSAIVDLDCGHGRTWEVSQIDGAKPSGSDYPCL